MGDEILFNEKTEPPGTVVDTKDQNHYQTFYKFTINETIPDQKLPQHSLKKSLSSKTHFIIPDQSNLQITLFRKRWYPQATQEQWNDWRWQLQNRITTYQQIDQMFHLSADEKSALLLGNKRLPVSLTPYYASLLDIHNSSHALRKIVIPVIQETIQTKGESLDPLAENHQSPIKGLVHRYPDRVLFLVSNVCASYCRYCTRSRIIAACRDKHSTFKSQLEKCFEYIESHPEIRDVLLSGGDPLMLPDATLQKILERLRKIEHVEIIRIGTRTPVVLPQRITPSLVQMLRKYHPLFMSIHFTHPEEITREVTDACCRLADAGIPLGSQSVLLAGINDSVETMRQLFHKLLKIRVRPYYLYQCDPILGSGHLRSSVKKGIEIIKSLRGFTSGYAIPHYVIDAPGGGGKIPISPDYLIGYEGDTLLMKNFENKIYGYVDHE